MINKFLADNKQETLDIVRDLCKIPAPSFLEDKRAEYCKKYFESFGAKNVYIDSAKNVIFPLNCENSNNITVFAAHTDTVFPDIESYPEYREDEENIYCPGVGDDTVCVAMVLMTAKYYLENNIVPKEGVLFLCNSCEEGLGDLKGARTLMNDFKDRVKYFITLDATIGGIITGAVGSHRYNVQVKTEGGHSFSKFGNKNAITELSKIVTEIYDIEVPKKDGATTTYNVGTISGGTSVNTIAQDAEMLCEYRSDDKECLAFMENKFNEIFKKANDGGLDITVTRVGNRPCKGDVDKVGEQKIVDAYRQTIKEITNEEIKIKTASTDANIPLSLGIPSADIGVYVGGGAHTREEWVNKDSIIVGVHTAIEFLQKLTK